MSGGFVKLGDVCEVQNGFAFDSKCFSTDESEGMPLIRIRDILNGYTNTYYSGDYQEEYVVHKGDFLIGMDGDFNIGQWNSADALLNQRVCRLIPSSKVLPRFIYYYIPTALQEINKKTVYTTVKHLSSKQVKAILLPVYSMSEQQRIVDALDIEFEKINALMLNAERAIRDAKRLYMAALEKELTPKIGWKSISVGEVASLITKGASPKWQGNQYVSSGGILFITSENVREGYLDISVPKYVDTGFNIKQARSILHKDDVLVNIVGASIGRAAVFNLDVKNANTNQAVALVRLDKERVLPDYLCCFLNSSMAERFYASMKKDTARANLSLENISDIVFPCPASIAEQREITDRLLQEQKKCMQIVINYNKTLSLCDDLKQAILKRAFNSAV